MIKNLAFLFLLVISSEGLMAQAIKELNIEISTEDQVLSYYFDWIEKEHAISIYYDNTKVNLNQPVRSLKNSISLEEFFDRVFSQDQFDIIFKERSILIKPKSDHGSSDKVTIKGFISDAANGEVLLGAIIGDVATGKGVITNTYGFYSLSLTKGAAHLSASYVGFQKQKLSFDLQKDTTINIYLSSNQLEAVVIEGTDEDDLGYKSAYMGTHQMTGAELKYRSTFFGEPDILKSLQLLPGVSMVDESSSKLLVRGGDADQNLILLDGVPVYNASHLFSFFSVFNPDAINNVSLIKGAFPARYGGRLSSVIDISMKEGNNKEFHGGGAIGLISSKLILEGPILNKKGSFLLTGRRTYFDVFKPLLDRELSYNWDGENITSRKDRSYYFYDFSGKVNYRFSDKDKVYLSFYSGKDLGWFNTEVLTSSEDYSARSNKNNDIGWKNSVGLFRWNHVWSKNLFSNIGISYSNYTFDASSLNYNKQVENDSTTINVSEYKVKSLIQDWTAKVDFDFLPVPNHHIRFGAIATRHRFNPNAITVQSSINEVKTAGGELFTNEYAMYVEDDFRLGKALVFNLGVHASAYDVRDQFYYAIQPRASFAAILSSRFSLKASYSEMQQYIHSLTHPSVGLPTDFWVPATNNIKPQESQQVSLGLFYSHQEKNWDVSVEAYYKDMTNLIEYKEGISFINTNVPWEEKVTVGKGNSYGSEFMIKKKFRKTEGWIGYTLSWANRLYPELNLGEPFPYKYDRRHQINVALNHNINDKIFLSCNWVYMSGFNITMPAAQYSSGLAEGFSNIGSETYLYTSRNAFKTRPYHRLDLSVRFNKKKKRGERNWVVSIYNTYNRKNTFYIDASVYDGYLSDDQGIKYVVEYEVSENTLFPLIPSISYEFNF